MKSPRNQAVERARQDAGFTLTEILVVLVIVAMLTALIAPNILGRLGGARVQTAEIQMENIAGALELFYIDTGRYPTSDEGLPSLVTRPDGLGGWTGPYFQRGEIPEDPWGRSFVYASTGPDSYQLMSYGRDGAEGGSGQDADLSIANSAEAQP